MTDSTRLAMMQWREGVLDLILDTDAATEVDDPFAISYILLSPERFRIKAIYAAPFAMNERAQDPAQGMQMSYEEIIHVMQLCRKEGYCPVFHGSEKWLTDKKHPVDSQAANDLAVRAMEYTAESPLYVLAIGAGTNIASALLKNPQIKERVVLVWLAGNDFSDSPNVYNIYQDKKSAQIIFDSGIPLIHIPCNHVTSHMITSVPELEYCLGGKNELCNYLIQIVKAYGQDYFAWGKTIWDLGAAGCLYKKEWSRIEFTAAPVLTDELTWSRDYRRHLIGNVRELNRDEIFKDAFRKMGRI